MTFEIRQASNLHGRQLLGARVDQAVEQMEGAHRITKRQANVVGELRVAIAQLLNFAAPILVGVAQVRDQDAHEVVAQLALPVLGGIVEARIPGLVRELAGRGRQARLPDEGIHEERELGRGLGG